MAWIQQRKRSDGGLSARVMWRLGGGRTGPAQVETFSAGTDEQNLARAEGFKKIVEAAGQLWPDGGGAVPDVSVKTSSLRVAES